MTVRVWRSRIILFTQQNPITAGSHCYLSDNWIKWQYVQEKWVKTMCAEQINTFYHLRRSQHWRYQNKHLHIQVWKKKTFWNSQLYLASTWQNDKSDCPQQSSILEPHLALFVSSQAWVGSNVISLCTSVNLMPLAATDTQNANAKWIGVLISIIQSGFIKPWVTCIQIHVCHVDSVINQEQCSVLWSSPDTDFMDTDAWVR